MNLNIYNQLFNLFIFIITGIVIGILFDIFRIIRKSFRTPDIITYIEDIVFWIATGCILLFTIFTFNNGEIRIYVFIGLIFGLVMYMLTLSKYFIKVNVTILNIIKKVVWYPISIIYNFIKKIIFRPLYHIFINVREKIAKLFKSINKKTENNNLS